MKIYSRLVHLKILCIIALTLVTTTDDRDYKERRENEFEEMIRWSKRCPAAKMCVLTFHREFVGSCLPIRHSQCGDCLSGYHANKGHIPCSSESPAPSNVVEHSRSDDLSSEISALDAFPVAVSKDSLKMEERERKREKSSPVLAESGSSKNGSGVTKTPMPHRESKKTIIIAVAVCGSVALIGLIIAITCWCCVHKSSKELSDDEDDSPKGVASLYAHQPQDRKLAQSAQMFHYQHQRQQMMAMESAAQEGFKGNSSPESEGDHEDTDQSIYECAGLASTGELEVRNPLFQDPQLSTTPVQPPPAPLGSKK